MVRPAYRGPQSCCDSNRRATTDPGKNVAGGTSTATTEAPKIDANILCVSLGELGNNVPISTGDPIFCVSCKAALNKYSNVNFNETSSQGHGGVWTCEFCDASNPIEIQSALELPQDESVDYILEPAPQVNQPKTESEESEDDSLLIFCIDVSGSMSTSTKITDPSFKASYNEKTHITRLESVKAAINNQIKHLAKTSPNKRIGLVTFNSSVTIIGDGLQPVTFVDDSKFDNFEQLMNDPQIAKHMSDWLPLSKSAKLLSEKVVGLEEGGSTALGPALVVSAALASKKPGSKIMICTDGEANIGIGSQDSSNATEFYRRVGTLAKQSGVAISVTTIRGTDCKLDNLGLLADLSSGLVNIVDPNKISDEFTNMLSVPVIATNVSIELFLHRGFYVRQPGFSQMQSHITKDVGNVTADSDITFLYAPRPQELENVKQVSFQGQTRFTKLDGMRCLRVQTFVKQMTNDLAAAESEVDLNVVGLAVVQQTATFAQNSGNAEESRGLALQSAQLLQRLAQTPDQQAAAAQWIGHQNTLNNALDRDSARRNNSRDDETSNAYYNMKNMSYRRS